MQIRSSILTASLPRCRCSGLMCPRTPDKSSTNSWAPANARSWRLETMPASKFDFVPTGSAFTNVRAFGVQARHIAFCLNEVATALLGEPMLPHTDQEGPRNLTSKEDIVRYLKDAFAHAHRALGTLTNENLVEQIRDPYVEKLRLRDSTQRRFSSRTLGITTGKSWSTCE
jgi:hypothetical protein